MTILSEDTLAIMRNRFAQCENDEQIGEVYDDLYFGFRVERGANWMKHHWQQVAQELREVQNAVQKVAHE